MEARRDVFQAIADPTRRLIIGLIAGNAMSLNAIAENFEISRPAVSQHIKILEECGVVVIRQEGRERFCEARMEGLDEVSDWVEKQRKLWNGRFDKIGSLLEELKAKDHKKKRRLK
jgi:DNA-binding transcriptional ArsR family regulator